MKTLCLMKFSALGDLVQLEPFLPSLSEHFEITLFTSPLGYAYFETSPYIKNFIILPSKKLKDILFSIPHFVKKFDIFIDLQGNDRSKFLSLFALTEAYSNYHKNFTIASLSYDMQTYIKKDSMYHLDLFSILSMLNISFSFSSFRAKPKNYIVLNCGSSPKWISKRLPEAKWKEIAQTLYDFYKLPFILTGDTSEYTYCDTIGRIIAVPFTNMAGKTTLFELKTLLNNAFLVVSTDSASMHIAAICGTPTIGVFGATNWVRSAPFGPWSTTLHDTHFYRDSTPPKINNQQSGHYYDTISITPALDELSLYLS